MGESFFENRNHILSRRIDGRIIVWITYVLYLVVVISLNHIELTSAYTMLVIMILNVVIVRCFWKCDFSQVLAIVGGYFLAMFLEGNVVISITGIVGGEELIQKCTGEQGVIRVVYLLINGAIWYILNSSMIIIARGARIIKTKSMGYVAGISIVGFVGSAFIGTMLVNSFSVQIGTTWYVFLTILLMCVFGFYFIMKQKEAQLRMTILSTKNEMLEKNYIQVNEFYSANAKLYHDMNHHFDAIYHMLQHGEVQDAQKYIESLRNNNCDVQMKTQSGINVLDAVLYEMERKAERKGVLLTIEIPMLPCDLGIENSDICSLFANLMENAIEAAEKEVVLRVRAINEALLLVVQNDYCLEPIMRDNRFITTKKERNAHGWGTQIVEEIVQKYEGNVEYDVGNGCFKVNVMLNERRK